MDFGFTEEQNILLNAAKSFFEKEAKNAAREAEKTEEGYSPQLWQKMSELGWFGIVFPEEYDGFGGSFVDLALLIEGMGKALLPGPYIPTIISGLSILEYGEKWQKEELLPMIVEGKRILSHALLQPNPAMGAIPMAERLSMRDGNFIINGTRVFVPFGHVADWFVYGADTPEGKTIFLVDAKSEGVRCKPLDSTGNDKPCELVFDGVSVPEKNILGGLGKGTEIINKINAWGALAESAYITGMLEEVLRMSVEYAKEREQFERKIGSFQGIQHQCSDMATDVDQVKFLTYEAAWRLSENLSADKEISMAKSWASDASRRVCLLGVKIHGGTGVSEEHDMQLYFRRAKAAEVAFGDGDVHREIIAKELGL
ncbi:MAG: acyl-CoA dehydrogenase family protein [Pseudomonadota bacterium]